MYEEIINEILNLKDDVKKEILQRFFKTGKGEYGENDSFLGITVPVLKNVAKKYYKSINLEDTVLLLHNKYHEVRLTALFILKSKYNCGDKDIKQTIYNLYLSNTLYINNWDLVDSSAQYIVGNYIFENDIDKKVLYKLIDSNNLWEQRIAIIATHYFINNSNYKDILLMSEKLINHKHDLIHKALGWMLREVGKKDYKVLYDFLKENYKKMPRTMLRYAIERMDAIDKKQFMSK